MSLLGAGLLMAGLAVAVMTCLRRWDRALRRELREALADARDAEAARERAEQQRSLLMREVNHRSKNLLSVVLSMIRMTRARDPAEFGATLTGRIAALDRAHILLAGSDWQVVDLRLLVQQELAACMSERVALEGPETLLAASAAQPVAIILHELATYSAKYGALACDGALTVRWAVDGGVLRIRWIETGCALPEIPPRQSGFGTRVIDASARQLGGGVQRLWQSTGLSCEITLPGEVVARREAERAA